MKFERHRVLANSAVQNRPNTSSFNYRGPAQTIKSLQQNAAKTSFQGMLDLLQTDQCLERFFRQH